MLKVVSDRKDLCSVVSMCFLIHRISSIPSAEDFAFICLDILVLVLLIPDLVFHISGPGRWALHTARSIELRPYWRPFTRLLWRIIFD
jgi:hypothetical protein